MYEGKILASSLLVVPAYYKWPFTADNDLQLTYVLTHPEYRGWGLAESTVRMAIRQNQRAGRCIWYVTNTKNVASRNLCKKMGFEFAGFGAKIGLSLQQVND